jgi:RNA methyltransferase, TrmH family
VITSPQNPRVKDAAKLRNARARRKQQRIVIDGARELLRAIQSGVELLELFVCDELCQSDGCRGVLKTLTDEPRAVRNQLEILEVSRAVFDKLAFGQRVEGVIGVANTPSRRLGDLTLPTNPLVAVLEGVEKPGNVGAVLRTADAAGLSALIVADGGTDLYNPNAIRASLGAIFNLPVCSATSGETVEWIRARGLTIYTARVDAATNYTSADFIRPCAIVLGSEAAGLSDRWSQPADEQRSKIVPIRLPMLGHVDSLNVSAAAAILFYEALRQRQLTAKETLSEA